MSITINTLNGTVNGNIDTYNNYPQTQPPKHPAAQHAQDAELVEDIVPVTTTSQSETIENKQEELKSIFQYFTDIATDTDLEVLKKECQHRYAATRVIDLLVDWEGDKTVTKGFTMEQVYADLVTFCNRYNIPFVKQDSFESAYNKRYCDNRVKYCRIFK